ncbi:MAG: excinuclease ABC subunit UvrA [Bacteriovoracaceae bacterium]|nr:excinuclease ABC subunit UvrA [Bacteriovoracaceae bacterium]
MSLDEIIVNKSKVHNLKSVNVSIPKNALTVITGPSGSGKSSLAFDTIYVEGQRRYIESLSSYARQFLGQHQPPDVESISGLSPAIAIDQKTSSKNPRSTVGTVTEIYDYMRVLYARAGTLFCPDTGEEIIRYSANQIVKTLLKSPNKTKIQLLAPVIEGKTGSLKSEISKFLSMGFSRARIDGEIVMLEDDLKLDKKKHTVEIIIDRIVIKDGIRKRLTDSVEYGLKTGEGTLVVIVGNEEFTFSENNMSPTTKRVFPDLEPPIFSFNSPLGACPECNGLGESNVLDPKLMIFDQNLSITQGAVLPIAKRNSFFYKMFLNVVNQDSIDISVPYKDLPEDFKHTLFYGSDKIYTFSFVSENSKFDFKKNFKGIIAWQHKKYHNTASEKARKEIERYMIIKTCPLCKGNRLNEVAISTKIGGKNITELSSLSVIALSEFMNKLKLTGEKKIIAEKLLKEIRSRLQFLIDVGLDYLTLHRPAMGLSGGESQRIRLATQIGSALTGVLYVLDEPSIGLHQRDNAKLINTLKSLRDLGNTVLVVEHDEETMMASDHIIDMGPGAGTHGGEVVAEGTAKQIMKVKSSPTGRFLSGEISIEIPKKRRELETFIKLFGATHNNLEKVDVNFPLGGLVCVTGVSGSGKSTLVHEVLIPAIKNYMSSGRNPIYDRENYRAISGVQEIKQVIDLNQSPIGRTPKSNPATYSGVFDEIRKLYSLTPESKARGYKAGRFSFNVKGGRCEECEGNGVKKIEMHFLPDVYITCDECRGTRFNRETLSILYKAKHISDVLNMTIEEAHQFFINHPKISRILGTMVNVGLGYMKLGQPATTLSGGEAQRLKLSSELAKRTKGHCFYILDEPTTGLHFQDVKILMEALEQLIVKGHSVLVIEHNLDVIKLADCVIDLGPGGGDKGGKIVAVGTPEQVAKNKNSFTGHFLKEMLKKK